VPVTQAKAGAGRSRVSPALTADAATRHASLPAPTREAGIPGTGTTAHGTARRSVRLRSPSLLVPPLHTLPASAAKAAECISCTADGLEVAKVQLEPQGLFTN